MNLLTIITVCVVSLILLYRTLYMSGCKLPAAKKGFLTAKPKEYTGYSYTKKDLIRVAAESLIFRIVMYFASFLCA